MHILILLGDWPRLLLQNEMSVMAQSSVALLLGLVMLVLVKQKGAELKTLVCRATLCALLAALAANALIGGHIRPLWRVTLPQPPRAATTKHALHQPAEYDRFISLSARARAVRPNSKVLHNKQQTLIVRPASNQLSFRPNIVIAAYLIACVIWPVGSLVLLLRLSTGLIRLRRISRSAFPAQAEVVDLARAIACEMKMQPPIVLEHKQVTIPFVAGWGDDASLFLPPNSSDLFTRQALRAVLAHELAHLRFLDYGWNVLFAVTKAILWPQPLLHIVYRQWKRAAEQRCDRWAIDAAHCAATEYADCLLRLSERHLERGALRNSGAVGMIFAPSDLSTRIHAIFDTTQARLRALSPLVRAACGLTAAAAAALSLLLVSTSSYGRTVARAAHISLPAHPIVISSFNYSDGFQNPSDSTKHSRSQTMFNSLTRHVAPIAASLVSLLGNPVSVALPSSAQPTAAAISAPAIASAQPTTTGSASAQPSAELMKKYPHGYVNENGTIYPLSSSPAVSLPFPAGSFVTSGDLMKAFPHGFITQHGVLAPMGDYSPANIPQPPPGYRVVSPDSRITPYSSPGPSTITLDDRSGPISTVYVPTPSLSPVTLTAEDMPIRDALRAVLKDQPVGYSISPDVTGNVSVEIHNAPLLDALLAIVNNCSSPLSVHLLGPDGTDNHGAADNYIGQFLQFKVPDNDQQKPDYRVLSVTLLSEHTTVKQALLDLCRQANLNYVLPNAVSSPWLKQTVSVNLKSVPLPPRA